MVRKIVTRAMGFSFTASLADVKKALKEKGLTKKDKIIFMCRSGKRSAYASKLMANAGYIYFHPLRTILMTSLKVLLKSIEKNSIPGTSMTFLTVSEGSAIGYIPATIKKA
jgi:hypothetical protein